MQPGKPSRTALAAAFHRAAHQVLDKGRIFRDPLALRILGIDAETVARKAQENPSAARMRLFIAARTRFAEDALAAAIEQGVRQLVVLGAGLDTYAYRSPSIDRLRIIEVDHPVTQAWKRCRLQEAAISIPSSLTFASIDFEHETLAERLAAAGLDRSLPSFFTWLGVVPYLNEDAVWSTLGFIARLPLDPQVVFDYGDPPESLSPESRALHEKRAARVAELGEAWVTHFEPEDLHARLSALGFTEIEDLGPPQIAARYLPEPIHPLPARGGHIVRAGRSRRSHMTILA